MAKQLGSDIFGILKGVLIVSNECLKLHESQIKHFWVNSSLKNSIVNTSVAPKVWSTINLEKWGKEAIQRSSMIVVGVKVFASEWQDMKKKDLFETSYQSKQNNNILNVTPLSVENLKSESNSSYNELPKNESIEEINKVNTDKSRQFQKKEKSDQLLEQESRQILKENNLKIQENPDFKYEQALSETAKATKVPASRLGRLVSFGSLAAGLGFGTMAEVTRRTLGFNQSEYDNPFLTQANAERIVNTLCKVRGAALKIGQLLSIQDNTVISPALQQAFERVRQSADFMPSYQVQKVLRDQLGENWRSHFAEFELKPFAAASIGQVHYGKTQEGIEVAVKIQYPGVAQGINSDIENLVGVLKLWNVFPEGMFIDKVVEVAKKELSWEVDYIREAKCTKKFKQLLSSYPEYFVPAVIDHLSTKEIFTTELIRGVPVDKCVTLDSVTKNEICLLIMNLCLNELFRFRFMQTDPNWSNFFYNQNTKQLILLDFGATRSYEKQFMDKYITIIKAAADGDRKQVLLLSREMGFLTGFESKAMEDAHVESVMILGEVFSDKNSEFDFSSQDTTLRITKLVPTILNHRLCPPPEEIYSLHRKLSGVFLLCAKLGVKIPCRNLFMNVYQNYLFD